VAHVVEQLVGRRLLGLDAAVHDHDTVTASRDDTHVVSDEQDAHVEFRAERVDDVEDLGLNGHIEGGRGFVGDQQFGLADETHGDDDALAKAPRVRRVLVQSLGGRGISTISSTSRARFRASSSLTPS